MGSAELVLEFVEHLVARRITMAVRLLAPESQATGPQITLHDLSHHLKTQYGKLVSSRVVTVVPRPDGSEAVTALLEFKRETFLCYAFTRGGAIVTFAFDATEGEKYLSMLENSETAKK